MSKIRNLQLFITLACRSKHCALASVSSSLLLIWLFSLGGHSCRSHELIYLLVSFLYLASQQIFDLLLVAIEGRCKRLWCLMAREGSVWRRSLERLRLSLTNGCLLDLRKLRLIWFHSEWDYTSSNLHSLGHFRLEFNLPLSEYKGSKLWKVIFKIESTILLVIFYESMTPRHWNIAYSHITLMTTS